MTHAIATSADGNFAVARVGSKISVIGGDAAIELPNDDVDLAIAGPPSSVICVQRQPLPRVVLYTLPELEPAAAIELDAYMALVAVTGPRVVLATADRKKLVIVRVAARALAGQAIDPGGIPEAAIGLEKNQLLLALPKKLEVWDTIAGRPLARLQLQLPAPPRVIGASLGHLWATRPGTDEVYVYRLSDGRPFKHHVGAPIERAIGHPASAVVVLVTAHKLHRLHCFAHSLTAIDLPVDGALALHGTGDEVDLLGISAAGEIWRRPLGAAHAAATEAPSIPAATPVERRPAGWRDPLAATITDLVRTDDALRVPTLALPEDCELAVFARELGLGEAARRALTLLYGLSLTGQVLSIAQLARILGDWSEPLGQGELGKHDLLRRTACGVRLRRAALERLDGASRDRPGS